jgi:inositol hexakisphosphate/diphosphoinositol-pentakisphosphate kinase
MYKRWRKLSVDFYDIKKKSYNTSKIPDIYDSIKYDILHNASILKKVMKEEEIIIFTSKVKKLANFVVPNENGMNKEERL